MARKSSQIKWMPAYKADDDRILAHYQRALGKKCDRKRASQLFKQDRDHYWRDMGGSRIQYDKLTDTWRGRFSGLPSAKFGVVRDHDPKLLRNILRANIGAKYFTKDELKALFAKLFGSEKVKSKFKQAHGREIIKFSDPVWHLSTTPPPGALYVHQEATAGQTAPIDPAEPKAEEVPPSHPDAQLGEDYVWRVDDGSIWIGRPGTRRLLPQQAIEALEAMPRMEHWKGRAEVRRIVNFKGDDKKLFMGLCDEGIITTRGSRDYSGDLQGMKGWVKEGCPMRDERAGGY
jgi:hypothetical protein